jgi:hypothetical protein
MNEATGRNRTLTPRQLIALNELFQLGASRPLSPDGVVEDLTRRLQEGTAQAVTRWTERSLYLTKSQVLTALRCEGQLAAEVANTSRGSLHPAVVVGICAHRAIQLAYTHPLRPVSEYVRQAVVGSRSADESVDLWWAQADASTQSDAISQITSKVTNFLDDFPPLDPAWSPRFEEPMVARLGKLTLSARPDLLIGRPRADRRQSMLIVDLKTGSLNPEHDDEAMFYALVAALRFGMLPWRSTVYSLASGEWTEPDVTVDKLEAAATRVIKAANATVAVLTESREPVLIPGNHCRWCPARATCTAANERGTTA